MAGTKRDRAGLLAIDTGTYIPDNTAGLVDPLNHRSSNEDINASTTNFLDDNFEIDADGSHKYTLDPTGAWDGSAAHDLKLIPKKWLDTVLSTFPTSLENGLNVLGGIGKLGGDLTEDTSVNLYDTVGATGRNLKVTYGASDISLLVLDNSGSFTLGGNASTFGSTSVAIGANAVANREKSVSIGSGAGNTTGTSTANSNTISIGNGANGGTANMGYKAIAIGENAQSNSGFSIVIGRLAVASAGNSDIAIGSSTSITTGLGSAIAFGTSAVAGGTRSMSIGAGANSVNTESIAIGRFANATQNYAVALGLNAGATGAQSVSIGRDSDATTTSCVAVGYLSQATFSEAVAIGVNVQSSANRATTIGNDVINSIADSFAYGSASTVPSFHYSTSGYWFVDSLSVYPDDATAGGAGLTTGRIYKTATGELRIKI